jgi:organic hydroperoxide reductase OsmC/OhrA
MHIFETKTLWERDKVFQVKSAGLPALTASTPTEFGGPGGHWTPEHFLVGSVESCLLSTFLYFAERFRLSLCSYSSSAQGTVEKTPEGLRFTGIDVSIQCTVADRSAVEKIASLHLKDKLEKYCLISASLAFPVSIELDADPADALA